MFRLVLVSLAGSFALSVSACGPHTSPHCGSNTFSARLPDAGDITGAVITTDDQTCGASVGGPSYVNVSRLSAGSCQVQVVLVDGETYTFTVEFGATGTGGCEGALGILDASSPVLIDAGPCHGPGGGTADAGTLLSPSCAGLVTAGGPEPIKGCGCTAADPQLCYEPCGPEGLGAQSLTCTGGHYVRTFLCNFDPAKDYSCYTIPYAVENPTCPKDASGTYVKPLDGTACTVDHCVVCNGYGGFPSGEWIDCAGMRRGGYCVCQLPDSAGNRSWSCADAWAWPCPDGRGC